MFVDLRSAPQGHWLRGEFVSLSLGRAVNSAPWSKVIDAFFYRQGGTGSIPAERSLIICMEVPYRKKMEMLWATILRRDNQVPRGNRLPTDLKTEEGDRTERLCD